MAIVLLLIRGAVQRHNGRAIKERVLLEFRRCVIIDANLEREVIVLAANGLVAHLGQQGLGTIMTTKVRRRRGGALERTCRSVGGRAPPAERLVNVDDRPANKLS